MALEEHFSRLIQILRLLESQPWVWGTDELAVEMNVSRATIERDIAVLRQWGRITRKRGKFGVGEMKFLPASFTAAEALALRLAGSAFADHAGAPSRDALRTALKKIDTALPSRVAADLKKADQRVAISQLGVRGFSPQVYEDLQGATLHHHPVDITYFSRGSQEPTRRRVNPYGLAFKIGGWYLVAYCHLRQGIRTFALDRIRWLRVDETARFRYPADFHLNEWLARGWQLQAEGEPTEVVIRFDSSIAEWIAGGQWHPTQKMEKQSDGSLLFRVIVAGYEEMLYWVLSFGANAEALEPAPLRVAVAEAARKMTQVYSANGT